MDSGRIPACLRDRDHWVLWKMASRAPGEDPTKTPFQTSGRRAKANDPKTWTSFDKAIAAVEGYSGVGYEFGEGDQICGIDFDGCRDPETGTVADWAREWILKLDSYSEVSPSLSGVKVWVHGSSPFPTGKNLKLPQFPAMGGKAAGIEIYDHGRYFAVTGMRLGKVSEELELRQRQLKALCDHFWQPVSPPSRQSRAGDGSVVVRARKYAQRLPVAVTGQNGSGAAFRIACVLVIGFGLTESEAMGVMLEWNDRCQPPWSERELKHKLSDATKQPGERNYLRNSNSKQWDTIEVPQYDQPPPTVDESEASVGDDAPAAEKPVEKTGPTRSTLRKATGKYLDLLEEGGGKLIGLGLPDVDYAIGGGVAPGEMVILAARPSQGKSAVALQIIHNLTAEGIPCAMISEEMSQLAIGKRVIQYASTTPEEHWQNDIHVVRKHLDGHFGDRAKCVLIESCQTVERAAAEIEVAVKDHGVQVAVVDYAQILGSKGNTRYEQITRTSITLRQLATSSGVTLLVLCQLNRQIEGRDRSIPIMSDLKDTGQLEQDADVILFMAWPHRQDPSKPPHEFHFFVGKNRNRAINAAAVQCEFRPSRQAFLPEKPADQQTQSRAPYSERYSEFDDFNKSG